MSRWRCSIRSDVGSLGDIADRGSFARKSAVVLRAINELQFDHEMGKLSAEDYKAVRDLYELRAIEVMRALDADPDLHPKVAEDLAALEGGARTAKA